MFNNKILKYKGVIQFKKRQKKVFKVKFMEIKEVKVLRLQKMIISINHVGIN